MWERSSVAFATFGLSAFFCPHILASDWNTATGGNSARSGFVAEVGPSTAAVLWEGGLPSEIAMQPVIEGDVVVSTRIAATSNKGSTTRIVAQDVRSGDVLWDVALPFTSRLSDWHSRVSAIKDGRVFVTRAGDTNSAYLYALDVRDGSQLWRSEHRVDECSTESLAFASDGDLVVGNFNSVMRIDADDGTTVWSTARKSPTSDASSVAVHNNRFYIWEATRSGPCVTAIDGATGDRIYSSDGIGGGSIQQLGLMVGADGTIYAPRTQDVPGADSLVALSDSGDGIIERWRVALPYVPLASFAIGPDGSIYTYSANFEIIRVSPENGAIQNRSEPIQSDFHQPRMAIGANGMIYLTNGGFAQGRLYSFNPDLSSRWSVPVLNVGHSGPSLGANGILVVCGVGEDVRAFSDNRSSCAPDWNLDGELNSADLFDFLNDFFNNRADFNGDGVTNSADFFSFVNPYMMGC